MSTTNTTVTPGDGWFSIFTGPTTKPISVEKNTGSSDAYLAIGTSKPNINFGHSIRNGELKNVALVAGENLYVKCVDSLSPQTVNIFTVTG